MMNHANPLSGAIADAIIPAKELIIGSGYAWALLVVLLVLCCTVLWLLTQPVDGNVSIRRFGSDGSLRPRRHGSPTHHRSVGHRVLMRHAASPLLALLRR